MCRIGKDKPQEVGRKKRKTRKKRKEKRRKDVQI